MPTEVPEAPAESSSAIGSGPQPELVVLKPLSGWRLVDLREVWRHRELLLFFTWRDITVRYKQTLLGAAWALIQPALMMVVFTIFLGHMAGVDSGGYPYPIFVYAGLLPWTFFAGSISRAGNSVVSAQNIITKVYFPRLVLPMASVTAALLDFFIAFMLMLVLMGVYRVALSPAMLLLPMVLALAFLAAVGVGTIMAALNVAYRDLRQVLPFIVQIWLFATPTVYMNIDGPSRETAQTPVAVAVAHTNGGAADDKTTVPEKQPADAEEPAASTGSILPAGAKALLALNPMTGIIGFFRAVILGNTLPWIALAQSAAIIFGLLLLGLFYFYRSESSFADVI